MKISVSSYSFAQYIAKGLMTELDCVAKAKELGSDYIVVGRPITAAEDPVAAYRRCVAEFVG